MKPIKITSEGISESAGKLKAGDEVLLSGTIYTARDTAHKRIYDLVKKRKRLPVDFRGKIIYYCGPTPAKPGRAIGSCGPTTASRMDPFTPCMLKLGVSALIGKGRRSVAVRKEIKKRRSVYFLATGGIGALLAGKVKSSRPVLFNDLGPEAVYKLEVEDFPLIVGIDSKGRDIYNG